MLPGVSPAKFQAPKCASRPDSDKLGVHLVLGWGMSFCSSLLCREGTDLEHLVINHCGNMLQKKMENHDKLRICGSYFFDGPRSESKMAMENAPMISNERLLP